MRKKICVITGTRAEYGLFHPLLKKIKRDDFFRLQLAATGMHLSPDFGLTYKEIEGDGFTIDEKVEMLLPTDTEVGISKSIGLGISGFADAYERLKPDMVILLGDRFETFAAAVSAYIAKIPIVHLYGGEVTEGVFDEGLRHSITKMAYLHLTSLEEYRRRVIQLGESPERVFNVGALGLDNICNMTLLTKDVLENQLNVNFDGKTALLTYHPVTLEVKTAKDQLRSILSALDSIEGLRVIITKPNADTDGRVISKMIDAYVQKNLGKHVSFVSLGQLKYLSILQYVDLVVGNSSSGIIEVPSFGKPTVNIGDRQTGRVKGESIIDCGCREEEIKKAVEKALSHRFQLFCKTVKNEYGDGNASERIVKILKEKMREPINMKKKFVDMVVETEEKQPIYIGACVSDQFYCN